MILTSLRDLFFGEKVLDFHVDLFGFYIYDIENLQMDNQLFVPVAKLTVETVRGVRLSLPLI